MPLDLLPAAERIPVGSTLIDRLVGASATTVDGVSKESEITAIANLVGIPDPGLGVGSSVPKALFDGICARFGIDASGTMPQQAQRIVTAANLPYRSDLFDSRETPSQGGSTVTLEGLQRIKEAVLILLG
jgi:hypothetical protein